MYSRISGAFLDNSRRDSSSLAELAPSFVSSPATSKVRAEVLLVESPRVSLKIAPKISCAAVWFIFQLRAFAISKITSPAELASSRTSSCSNVISGVASVW